MIDSAVMNLLMEMATFSFVIPVALIAVWKMRTRKSLLPVFAGMGVFFLFVYILEAVPHTLFLRIPSPISAFLNGNPWAYALYGGIMAALFEETGRYLAFKFLLAKHTERETAVSYGLGHGGLECILVLGLGHLQNFTYCQLINNGQMDKMIASMQDNPAAVKSYQSIVESLSNLKVSDIMWGGAERVSVLFLQIALSVMVFYAVREVGQIRYLWIAMGVHALVDFITAFYRAEVVPLFVVEICIMIMAVGACKLAYRMYQSLPKDLTGQTAKSSWSYANTRYKEIKAQNTGEGDVPDGDVEKADSPEDNT